MRALLTAFCAVAAVSCNAPGHSAGGKLERVESATGPMNLAAARRYVLELVNRDRTAAGLAPVAWDPVAEAAGQRHVEDMVRVGFTAHWGSDGSVPEQRYTEAGGVHFVQENAACFFDGQARELDPNPVFEPAQLEQIESAFINELPPSDGHKKNILKPVHSHLGIGLAKPVDVAQPCMTQEFVDQHGEYESLPREIAPRQPLTVSGRVVAPVTFGGIGVSRLPPAVPLAAEHLNGTNVYPVPEPAVMYFPEGYKTPKPVRLEGDRFAIELTLAEDGAPGRYGVSVWGKYPGADALVMISLRTVTVR